MLALANSLNRNFIDCKWFQSCTKASFLLVMIFQLLQAMAFNGVVDVPTMLLLVTTKTVFAFRKVYAKFYA